MLLWFIMRQEEEAETFTRYLDNIGRAQVELDNRRARFHTHSRVLNNLDLVLPHRCSGRRLRGMYFLSATDRLTLRPKLCYGTAMCRTNRTQKISKHTENFGFSATELLGVCQDLFERYCLNILYLKRYEWLRGVSPAAQSNPTNVESSHFC